jgi:hypothetical protein
MVSSEIITDSSVNRSSIHSTAAVHFWTPIKRQIRNSTRESPDVHAHLMSRYPRGSRIPSSIVNSITEAGIQSPSGITESSLVGTRTIAAYGVWN